MAHVVTAQIASTSKEYIRVAIAAEEDGLAVDPTSATVSLLFTTDSDTPATDDADWKAGSWETDATTTPDTYYARILHVTEVQLTEGIYYVWVKPVLTPEEPVLLAAGLLQVV